VEKLMVSGIWGDASVFLGECVEKDEWGIPETEIEGFK